MKKLKVEKIQDIDFYFHDMGASEIMVTVFGYIDGKGDVIGLFNNVEEAKTNLEKATITKNLDNTISIKNLKSIGIGYYE